MGYNADAIKAQVPLLDVVRRVVDLQKRGHTWWACCPFHAEKTPSFQVTPDKGYWHCFGCGRHGDVIAFVQEAYHLDFTDTLSWLVERYRLSPVSDASQPPLRDRHRRRQRPSFQYLNHHSQGNQQGMRPYENAERDDETVKKIARANDWYASASPVAGTPGEDYLRGRGIPPMFPTLCGVKYADNWYGAGPAVLFPIYAPGIVPGEPWRLVAVQGRLLQRSAKYASEKLTVGPSGCGIFLTIHALTQPFVVITEAPIDALSLAICCVPAIAVIGSHPKCDQGGSRAWLLPLLQKKRLYAAFDNDPQNPDTPDAIPAGERGTIELRDALLTYGITIHRLRPEGVKDWNALLQQIGIDAMRQILTHTLQREFL